eukprot:Gb_09369 [translate_table: standard]
MAEHIIATHIPLFLRSTFISESTRENFSALLCSTPMAESSSPLLHISKWTKFCIFRSELPLLTDLLSFHDNCLLLAPLCVGVYHQISQVFETSNLQSLPSHPPQRIHPLTITFAATTSEAICLCHRQTNHTNHLIPCTASNLVSLPSPRSSTTPKCGAFETSDLQSLPSHPPQCIHPSTITFATSTNEALRLYHRQTNHTNHLIPCTASNLVGLPSPRNSTTPKCGVMPKIEEPRPPKMWNPLFQNGEPFYPVELPHFKIWNQLGEPPPQHEGLSVGPLQQKWNQGWNPFSSALWAFTLIFNDQKWLGANGSSTQRVC